MAIFKKHSFKLIEQVPVGRDHSHFRAGCTCDWVMTWFECSIEDAREKWEHHVRTA